MNIVLATALYPPDIAQPAPYVKDLATRLLPFHEVTIVAYGRLPEAIRGVRIISIDKRKPLPVRLVRFFFALWRATRKADVLYAQNGASVELPVGLVARLTRRPLIMALGDKAAREFATRHSLHGKIENFALKSARAVVAEVPPARPEILPLEPAPTQKLAEYEAAWKGHLKTLEQIFNHAG